MALYKPHPENKKCPKCKRDLVIRLLAGKKDVICLECDGIIST